MATTALEQLRLIRLLLNGPPCTAWATILNSTDDYVMVCEYGLNNGLIDPPCRCVGIFFSFKPTTTKQDVRRGVER